MSRLFYILIFFAAAVLFLSISVRLCLQLKHNVSGLEEKSGEVANESTYSKKFYSTYIVVVVAFMVSAAVIIIGLTDIGHRYAFVGRFIVALPILALLNALINRGTGQVVFSIIILIALFLYSGIIFIDFPEKSPIIEINDTKIVLGKTTFENLKNEGFDIYIQEYVDATVGYYDLLTSGEFKKYPNDRSIFLKNGFKSMTGRLLYPRYLLTREGAIIAEVGLYADKYNNRALEDCKIVYFKLDKDFIKELKSNSISLKLNGAELLMPIKFETLKNTFGEKLTSSYSGELYKADRYYGISWVTRSDHIFWNEYFSDIYYDEKNNMTSFELSTEIARDVQ